MWNRVPLRLLLVTLVGLFAVGVSPSKAALGVPDWPTCSGIVRSPRSGWPWESATRGGVVVSWYESLRLEIPELPNLPTLTTLGLNEKITVCSIVSSGVASPGLGTVGSTEIFAVRDGGVQLDLVRFDAEQVSLLLPQMTVSEISAPPATGEKVLERLAMVSPGDRSLANSLSRTFEDSRQLLVFNTIKMVEGTLNLTVAGSDDCGEFFLILLLKSGQLDIDDRVATGTGFALNVQGPPAPCERAAPGLVREILAVRTAVMFDRFGLSLRSAKGSALLQASKNVGWQELAVLRTIEKRRSFVGARQVVIRPESLGVWQRAAIRGCHDVKATFGSGRYLIVDDHHWLGPNLSCTRSAARGLLVTGGGTYSVNPPKLILHSSTGTTIELQIRN